MIHYLTMSSDAESARGAGCRAVGNADEAVGTSRSGDGPCVCALCRRRRGQGFPGSAAIAGEVHHARTGDIGGGPGDRNALVHHPGGTRGGGRDGNGGD